jgi:hypothetical protein
MEKRTAFPTINGVEVERSYFEESNSMEHTFYYKNIPCPQLILDSPAAIKLSAYELIRKDLDFVRAAVKHLIEMMEQQNEISHGFDGHDNQRFVILKSLHQSIVVSYGKCFANSAGGGNKRKKRLNRGVKLEKEFIKTLTSEQQYVHKDLINQRNEYIAHGGATNLEQAHTLVLLPPTTEFPPTIITKETHCGAMSPMYYNDVLLLVDSLQNAIRIKQKKRTESLIKNELLNLSKEEIASLVALKSVVTIDH